MYVCLLASLLQDLLQSISDHEPEYVSLKKEASALCQGPSNETDLLSKSSQVQDSSAAFVAEQLAQVAMARPGQDQLEATLSDYDRRLEELKARLAGSVGELERQLERARECDGVMGGLLSWVEAGEAELDSLRVRDPSSAVIEGQQQKCEVCAVHAILVQNIHVSLDLYMYLHVHISHVP